MKKLIFIFLLVMPFCKAADPNASWYAAVQGMPNWTQRNILILDNRQISQIPSGVYLPHLTRLFLRNNQIQTISPDIFTQFPNLTALIIYENPLSLDNVQQLRQAAAETGRNITILADDQAFNPFVGGALAFDPWSPYNPNPTPAPAEVPAGMTLAVNKTTDIKIDPIPSVTIGKEATIVNINLPENPTGLSTISLNLEDKDPLSSSTLEELLENSDQVNLTIGFTQDAAGKWHATFFEAGYFNSYKATQPALIKDPDTRLAIQYIVPLMIVKK